VSCNYLTLFGSSIIIDYVTTRYHGHPRKLVDSWFCDDIASDAAGPETIIRSLIQQMLPANMSIPDFVREIHKEYRVDQSFPKYPELLNIFKQLVQEATQDVYIILDDKNRQSSSTVWTSYSNALFDVVRICADYGSGNIHVLLSIIEQEMIQFPFRKQEQEQLFNVRDLSSNPDLQHYLEYRLRHPPLVVIPSDLEAAIREKLAEREEQ
jgi:hypothetical protein